METVSQYERYDTIIDAGIRKVEDTILLGPR